MSDMTRDDIIRMAIKCQLVTTSNRDGIYVDALQRFAALVAAAAEQPKPEPVESAKPDHEAIRWQLCLLAQTEEFSDEVRNQIGRGVWLIDVLQAALRREDNK